MRRGARIPSSISPPPCAATPRPRNREAAAMAPGHEIAIRAVGTALAGMSIAFAVYMLAYGDGKTRINGLEHLAIFAQPRGGSGGAARAESPASQTSSGGAAVDMATTGSVAASDAKAPPEKRPVEIVAA